MRLVIALLLLAALPAQPAGTPSGCDTLCGRWVLVPSRSDAIEPLIEAGLESYKPPRARRPRLPEPQNGAQALATAEMQRSLEELMEPPGVAELRKELLQAMRPRATLQIAGRNSEILIGSGDLPERIVEPGRPHSRVDAQGTAEIKTRWKSGALVITEKYDRKRELEESYKLGSDGTLTVLREIERPGIKKIRAQAVYSRQTEPVPDRN